MDKAIYDVVRSILIIGLALLGAYVVGYTRGATKALRALEDRLYIIESMVRDRVRRGEED